MNTHTRIRRIGPAHVPTCATEQQLDHLLLLVRLTPRTHDRYGRSWREQAQAALKMHWRAAGAAAIDYTLVTAEQGEQALWQARQAGTSIAIQTSGKPEALND